MFSCFASIVISHVCPASMMLNVSRTFLLGFQNARIQTWNEVDLWMLSEKLYPIEI